MAARSGGRPGAEGRLRAALGFKLDREVLVRRQTTKGATRRGRIEVGPSKLAQGPQAEQGAPFSLLLDPINN